MLDDTKAIISPDDVLLLSEDCQQIHVSHALLDYVQALLAGTRNSRWFETGLSPRAGIAMLACCKAYAFLEGRDFAIPEDVKAIFPGLARHRMSVPHGMETSVRSRFRTCWTRSQFPEQAMATVIAPPHADPSAKAFSRVRDRVLSRRGPMTPPFELEYRHIFVLPTRFGWGFGSCWFS